MYPVTTFVAATPVSSISEGVHYGRPALSDKILGTSKIRFQISAPHPEKHQSGAVKLLWNGEKDSLEDDVRPGQSHHVITLEMIAEVNTVLGNLRNTWTRSIGY
ncbi:hypothetical protein TNCV_193821 [Trichonephila clavipes]|nr:hypothetical protein TNCV_193821 [Trichonephila clavipes]